MLEKESRWVFALEGDLAEKPCLCVAAGAPDVRSPTAATLATAVASAAQQNPTAAAQVVASAAARAHPFPCIANMLAIPVSAT